MAKQFCMHHSPPSYDEAITLCGIGKFSEGNGFTEDEAQDIDALEVGETWVSPDYGVDLTVLRLA